MYVRVRFIDLSKYIHLINCAGFKVSVRYLTRAAGTQIRYANRWPGHSRLSVAGHLQLSALSRVCVDNEVLQLRIQIHLTGENLKTNKLRQKTLQI